MLLTEPSFGDKVILIFPFGTSSPCVCRAACAAAAALSRALARPSEIPDLSWDQIQPYNQPGWITTV